MVKISLNGSRFITIIIITCFNILLNEGGVLASSSTNEQQIQTIVAKIYGVALPIAVSMGIIKLLLGLFTLATSKGDPGALNNVKEDIFAVISGLLVIIGAVTLIKTIATGLGGI